MPELSTHEEFEHIRENRRNSKAQLSDEYFDGQVRTFRRGIDYSITSRSFRMKLYREASRRGLRMHILETDPDTFMAYSVNPDDTP